MRAGADILGRAGKRLKIHMRGEIGEPRIA
ncbi:Uncharacterised protein [Mycobacterium tuberculosis]|nr:Uncharacterised protein [Mycobacterium tuberculosis]